MNYNSHARTPIGILSFNRPALPSRVLESICEQIDLEKDCNVYLFQDGGSPVEGECLSLFEKYFPDGTVFSSEENLGIAQNFERAERFFFETLGAEVAFFFEDDLVLGRNYIKALRQLADFALTEARVGYFAAYGEHRASEAEQRSRSHEVVRMSHKWGFGLTRSHWLRQQPIVDRYLNIVKNKPYMNRDSIAIRALFKELGYSSPGTSQDAAKDVACHVLGVTKIMSYACFAKYEGSEGMHTRKDFYEKNGWGQTVVLDDIEPNLSMPSGDVLDAWIEDDRRQARASLVAADSGCSREDVINAYKFILGRLPESEEVIERRLGASVRGLRLSLLNSDEFRKKMAGLDSAQTK